VRSTDGGWQHNNRPDDDENVERLSSQIMELSDQLSQVTVERDQLEQRVKLIESSRNKTQENNRWESQCQRYEERIIELHSVIAELSKKMEESKDDVIKEESECESNIDNQSIVTDSFVDEKLRYRDEYEDYTSLAFERDLDFHTQSLRRGRRGLDKQHQDSIISDDTDKTDESKISSGYAKQLELQVLELLNVKDQLEQERMEKDDLEVKLAQREKELKLATQKINNLVVERDTFKRQISDLKSTVEYQEAKMESKAATKEPFLSRFAERRSLRKKKSVDKSKERGVMVQSPQLESDAQGIISSFAKLNKKSGVFGRSSTSPDHAQSPTSPELPPPLPAPLTGLPRSQSAEQDFANKCKEFEIEIEKISSHVEHLKSQNHVLSLTLEESKATCDGLTELLGRYESNNTALQIGLSYCDHMIECYDVLVALLETESAVNTVNHVSCGSSKAGSNRKSAESVAKHLISRLDRNSRPDSGLARDTCESRWEDSSGYSHTTSSTSTTSSGLDPDFSKHDENKLRDYISKLKIAKSQVQNTVMELESIHARDDPPESTLSSQGSHSPHHNNADLEMAVLVQELMGMREERADLRAKIYLLEKEKLGAELNLDQQQEKERILRTKVDHIQEQLLYQEAALKGDNNMVLEDREVYLHDRVENLLTTLEKMTRNSELRQKQSADLIDDLKKANGALTEALDKSKKKYQSKIRKLEQQMLGLMYTNPVTDTLSTQTSSSAQPENHFDNQH